MRHGMNTFLAGLLLAGLVNAASANAAEVALFYSNYQEERFRYMPGEYDGQYRTAGAIVKEAGFEWDRVESRAVESGVLVKKGYKVVVISYIGTMSAAEAAAIGDFVDKGGKVFGVYSNCAIEYKDGEFGKPDFGAISIRY